VGTAQGTASGTHSRYHWPYCRYLALKILLENCRYLSNTRYCRQNLMYHSFQELLVQLEVLLIPGTDDGYRSHSVEGTHYAWLMVACAHLLGLLTMDKPHKTAGTTLPCTQVSIALLPFSRYLPFAKLLLQLAPDTHGKLLIPFASNTPVANVGVTQYVSTDTQINCLFRTFLYHFLNSCSNASRPPRTNTSSICHPVVIC
jgi:hypothetical protein